MTPTPFADNLAEGIADENERRSAEEVLLTTIDQAADDKLTRSTIRLALSGHVEVARERDLDFLSRNRNRLHPPSRKAKGS